MANLPNTLVSRKLESNSNHERSVFNVNVSMNIYDIIDNSNAYRQKFKLYSHAISYTSKKPRYINGKLIR